MTHPKLNEKYRLWFRTKRRLDERLFNHVNGMDVEEIWIDEFCRCKLTQEDYTMYLEKFKNDTEK